MTGQTEIQTELAREVEALLNDLEDRSSRTSSTHIHWTDEDTTLGSIVGTTEHQGERR